MEEEKAVSSSGYGVPGDRSEALSAQVNPTQVDWNITLWNYESFCLLDILLLFKPLTTNVYQVFFL